MTKILWAETADICCIRAEGHAGYNPGNDIVCAAISALMQTLYAAMESVCHAMVAERHSDGRMAVVAYKSRDNRKEIETLFPWDFVRLGADCGGIRRLRADGAADARLREGAVNCFLYYNGNRHLGETRGKTPRRDVEANRPLDYDERTTDRQVG